MKDVQRHLEKLRHDAAACAVIASEATKRAKNELFLRLSQHLSILADEVEKAMRFHRPTRLKSALVTQ
jgi:hypothetical protein